MVNSRERINGGGEGGPFARWSVEDLQEALGLRLVGGHWYSPLGVVDLGAGEGSGNRGGGGGRHSQRGRGSDRCRGARHNAAAGPFLWRLGCKIFRTEVIWSIVMFGWSASNLLTSPWSTNSSPVLANGRLIPSWGTAVEAGAGIDISGMDKWMGECGFGDVCTRGG